MALYNSDVGLAHRFLDNAETWWGRKLLARHIPTAKQADLRDFAWHYLWQQRGDIA